MKMVNRNIKQHGYSRVKRSYPSSTAFPIQMKMQNLSISGFPIRTSNIKPSQIKTPNLTSKSSECLNMTQKSFKNTSEFSTNQG